MSSILQQKASGMSFNRRKINWALRGFKLKRKIFISYKNIERNDGK